MTIPEDLLQFIWKLRLFQTDQLKTVHGDPIHVVQVGEQNNNAGPDFLFSKIRIGREEWSGSVEIHVRSSDWFLHGHHHDPKYQNVILHVVWDDDQKVFHEDGSPIPTFRLANYVSEKLLGQYQRLMEGQRWIPCESQLHQLDRFKIEHWVDRMAIERMEEKSQVILALLQQFEGDWEKTFFVWLFRSFGFKVNAEAFQALGEQLSSLLLQKYRHDAFKLEAMIFGQAGFLSANFEEEYPLKLQQEYSYLKKAYHLKETHFPLLFSRMRPHNFPTIRLAQLASLLQNDRMRLQEILNVEKLNDFKVLLDDIQVATYWKTHFNFGKQSSMICDHRLSTRSQHIVMINAFIVFTFSYGTYLGLEEFKEKAMNWLEELPAERNNIIHKFEQIGVPALHAAHSQGLLHIKNKYCDLKQCLSCGIGLELLKR
ncbi:hypothetical protein SF1_32870 [Sphingobacterium faecium NBRC 15299]|uniref:DUF2851 family protein n=1 Tax=Sphingobacterium faecium TaxID=34087 RepID=UPI000D3D76BA|nr:DUF2851 family protein [Sphingobacterium faecium]PTX13611.1 uncharacterized protein DUF2851 [Sphingobacterium faecium]GEM65305.1 hypothetical protein SF1_32870 [Sphingobacterium faecium NBRC 15299]